MDPSVSPRFPIDKAKPREYDLYNKTYFSEEVRKMNAPKGKHAWMVRVGEKGQFVIPKEARELFDIKPGDTLILLGDEKRGIAIPPKDELQKYISGIFGDNSAEEGDPK